MNKKIMIGIMSFILLIAGGLTYLSFAHETKPRNEQKKSSIAEQVHDSSIASSQNNPRLGSFIDYDETVFNRATGTRILFFHAPWCFQCRELEKDIRANLDQIPPDTTIFKIDYDSNQALRRKYNVKLQTSFVKFDSQGVVTKNFVAYDEPTFANLQRNIL